VGPLGPCGNAVEISHPNGITTGYCHMSRFVPSLKRGDKVGTHQLIGYVGATGRASGPHLHFFAKKNGVFFDAQTLLVEGERTVPGPDRAAFIAAKADLDKRLDAIPLPEPPPEKPQPVAAGPASASASEGPSANGPAKQAGAIGSPSALANAAAEPGIHPSGFVEDDSDDDENAPSTDAPKPMGAPQAPAAASPDPAKSAKPAAAKDDDNDEL
jgi:hypothetical protein